MKRKTILTVALVAALTMLSACSNEQEDTDTDTSASTSQSIGTTEETSSSTAESASETTVTTTAESAEPETVSQTAEETESTETTAETQSEASTPLPARQGTQDNLLSLLSDNNMESNVLLSDYSLDTALGMWMQDADEPTLKLLETYYGISLNEKTERDKALLSFYSNYDGRIEDTEYEKWLRLDIANGLFADANITLSDDFKNALIDNYNAECKVMELQLNPNGSAEYINDWISDKTHEKIKNLITPNSLTDAETVLVNTVYFNGKWVDPYEEYQVEDTPFHNANGEVTTVDGMKSMESTYYENATAVAFAKDYSSWLPTEDGDYIDGDFKFIGILPKEGITDKNGNFSAGDIDIDSLLDSKTTDYDVQALLPKFKAESTNYLLEPLQELTGGPDTVFRTTTQAYISDIIQKVVVEVNESGTEAAAATAIITDNALAVVNPKIIKEVRLDHPFMFLIYDEANDVILFAGKIAKLPNAN